MPLFGYIADVLGLGPGWPGRAGLNGRARSGGPISDLRPARTGSGGLGRDSQNYCVGRARARACILELAGPARRPPGPAHANSVAIPTLNNLWPTRLGVM